MIQRVSYMEIKRKRLEKTRLNLRSSHFKKHRKVPRSAWNSPRGIGTNEGQIEMPNRELFGINGCGLVRECV